MKRVTVQMSDEMVEFLEKVASDEEKTVSAVVKQSVLMLQKQYDFEKSIKTGQLPQFLTELKEYIEKTKIEIEQLSDKEVK